MTLLQWFIFFLIVQVVHFAGTWKLYIKAGRKPWEAIVPVYNAVVLMQIIGRPRWWVILLFIPVVNLIMFPVVWVETLRSFGKNSTTDTILGVATLGLYIYYVNYTQDVKHIPERELKAKSKSGDTVSSLLYAIIVATLVHTYVLQPFTIPTPSLEKTLLVGDFLFVSKLNYGARTPMTAIAAPMVHDTIPILNKKSYLNWPQIPYFRLPGYEKVSKNDIVVFNWPVDTVHFFGDNKTVGLRKPIDKKSNYVKRCVGTPGDTFSLKDGVVFIDGKELILNDRARLQHYHKIYANGEVSPLLLKQYSVNEFSKNYKLNANISQQQIDAIRPYIISGGQNTDGSITIRTGLSGIPTQIIEQYKIIVDSMPGNTIDANLTIEKAEKLRHTTGIDSVVRSISRDGELRIFPHNKPDWNVDNMGSIYIPEKGKTVALNAKTLPFYKMIIAEYEKNDLKVNGDEIRINGKVATSYTFKQNYYWMMGDNRNNSEDSRYWGFVPEDHIVGKPVFIWLSIDQNETWGHIGKKIRWERMFTTVGGSGEPVSYFKYFLGLLVVWFIFDYFRKKRKTT